MATARFLTAEVASLQGLPVAIIKHGVCHNLCDVAVTHFFVGFIPYLNSKYMNVLKKCSVQRKPQKSKVSECVRYA